MRTKASIKDHAIHQMLIPFPIALLISSFIFDASGYILNRGDLWAAGAYLALGGIFMGLIAAVPGFIDYVFSIPPGSSAEKRGLKHMFIMVITLILFGAAWFIREDFLARPRMLQLVLELLGVITISIGGWLGGTLVNRNFIGVVHRYANAGKWKEKSIQVKPAELAEAADINELKLNQMKLIVINNKRIVLGYSEDGYFAFDDYCSHRGGSLADGVLICSTVQCLWHGSQFNIKTGEVKSGPAKEKISVYKVIEKGGKVFIQI